MNKMVTIDLYNEDILKASLKSSFSKYGFNSPNNRILLENVVDSAILTAKGLGDKTHLETVSASLGPGIEDIATNVALTGGIACLWELHLKFFASNLEEIKVFEIAKSKSKLRTLNVAEIARPIQNYYPYLKNDFKFVAELRNNLFHGNFHQLREEILKKLPEDRKHELNSTMAIMKLGKANGKVVRPHEITDLEEAKDAGMFLWFLSAGNSKLLGIVKDELSESLRELEILGDFNANCFNETKYYFNQLAKDGIKLSHEQEDFFWMKRKKHFGEKHKEPYFLDLYSVFNLKPDK